MSEQGYNNKNTPKHHKISKQKNVEPQIHQKTQNVAKLPQKRDNRAISVFAYNQN